MQADSRKKYVRLLETPHATPAAAAHLFTHVGKVAGPLKLLIGCGESLAGWLLLLDGLAMEWRSITIPRDPGCAVCGVRAKMTM